MRRLLAIILLLVATGATAHAQTAGWEFPAVSTYTATSADNGKILSSENAPGASITVNLPAPASVGAGWAMAFSEADGRGIVLDAPSGNYILAGQKTLTSLAAPSDSNYEYVSLQSDGTNFRLLSATPATIAWNGLSPQNFGAWSYLYTTGFAASASAGNTILSSAVAGGAVTITLPSTGLVPNGWTLSLYADGGNPITLDLNGVSGGTMIAPGGAVVTSFTIPASGNFASLSFDGSAFRILIEPLVEALPPLLASPPAIGETTPNTGAFTSLSATGSVAGTIAAHVPTNTALENACTAAADCPSGDPVFPNGVWRDDVYAGWGAAPEFFTIGSGACPQNAGAGDLGSCNPSADGNSWLGNPIVPGAPLEFGAGQPVKTVSGTVAATSGSGTVIVAGGNFAASAKNDLVSLTDVIGSPTPAGATYTGTITGVVNATTITVSPPVGFTTAGTQILSYGADNTVPMNAYETWEATLPNSPVDFVPADWGGYSFGISGPVAMAPGVAQQNGTLYALSASGFTCANAMAQVTSSNTSLNHISLDSGYLPVWGYMTTANGVTDLTEVEARHWQGSCGSATATATQPTVGSYVIDVTSTSGLATAMVSRGNSSAGIPDRAVIVKVETSTTDPASPCPGDLCIVINRPTTAALSSASVTFDQDPGGILCSGASCGVHLVNTVATEYDATDTAHVASGDHYGYGFLDQGSQVDATRVNFSEGIAPVAMDSTANGLDLNAAHLFNSVYSSTETNPVAILEMSGAKNFALNSGAIGGVFQHWIYDTTPPEDSFGAGVQWNTVASASPNDVVQFYSDQLAVNTADLQIQPYPRMSSTNGFVSFGGLGTCGTNFSYEQLPCAELAAIAALSGGFMLPTRNGLNVLGLNGLNGTLSQIYINAFSEDAAYELNPATDCPSLIPLTNGTSSFAITLPDDTSSGCQTILYESGTGALTVVPDQSGSNLATINGAANALPLTPNVAEVCRAIRTVTGHTNWACTAGLGGTLEQLMTQTLSLSGSYTIVAPLNCPAEVMIPNGTNNWTVTLPNGVGGGCDLFMFANGSGTVTLAPASGAMLNGVTSSITLTKDVPENVHSMALGGGNTSWAAK